MNQPLGETEAVVWGSGRQGRKHLRDTRFDFLPGAIVGAAMEEKSVFADGAFGHHHDGGESALEMFFLLPGCRQTPPKFTNRLRRVVIKITPAQ